LIDCVGRKKLCLNEDECLSSAGGSENVTRRSVVQEYIDKPLLLAGLKSHLRLYVLLTSTDPLRLYIYNDCILYLAGEKYLSPTAGNLVSTASFPSPL